LKNDPEIPAKKRGGSEREIANLKTRNGGNKGVGVGSTEMREGEKT